MIQRIQSIYLLIGALALVSLAFFDSLWFGPAAEEQDWFAPAMLVAAGLPALIGLISIFLYKDRKRQRKVVRVAEVLAVICLAVLAVGLYLGGLFESEPEGWSSADFVLLLVPVIAFIMFFMAGRAIDRDIALIRSMDRLR